MLSTVQLADFPDLLPPLLCGKIKFQQLFATGIDAAVCHPGERRFVMLRRFRRMRDSLIRRIHPAIDFHQMLCQIGACLTGKRVPVADIYVV